MVNALALLVPVVGIEFARIFEQELLRSLERDMDNQAALIRRFIEANPDGAFDPRHERILTASAKNGEGVEAWRDWLDGVPERSASRA